MKRPRVLISAFSCNPERGSEPGVGHFFVNALAKHCDLTVITEAVENRSAIERRQRIDPNYAGIDFHYIPWPWLSKQGKRIDDRGSLLFYHCLRRWERQAFKLARELTDARQYDLTHHLTMQGYREPGYLWRLPLPSVWGPIGGFAQIPWRYLPSLGFRGAMQHGMRNVGNLLQARLSPRVRCAARANARVICNTSASKDAMSRLYCTDASVIAEFGAEAVEETTRKSRDGRPMQIAWSGVHVARKALPILLHAVARLDRRVPVELQILGEGPETARWQRLATRLGVADRCIWHGRLARMHAMDVMRRCDVFALTSLLDGTSCVLNEAIALGLPVVCHRACGFADIVDERCGILIDLHSPGRSAQEFADAIVKLATDEHLRQRLSTGATRQAAQISVDERVAAMLEVYDQVLMHGSVGDEPSAGLCAVPV